MKLRGLVVSLLWSGVVLGCASSSAGPGALTPSTPDTPPAAAAAPGPSAVPATSSESRGEQRSTSDQPCANSSDAPRAAPNDASPAPAAVADRNLGSSKSHRAKVKELFALMDMERVLDAAVTESMAAQERANPALGQFRDIMLDFMRQYMSWKSLERGFVDDYMETFSEAEIDDMVAFYRTPTGAKAISAVPSLLKRGSERGMTQVEKHLPELQKRIQERVKE
jgi:hypothetical protein